MKKRFLILLAMVFAACLLVACGKKEDKEDPKKEEPSVKSGQVRYKATDSDLECWKEWWRIVQEPPFNDFSKLFQRWKFARALEDEMVFRKQVATEEEKIRLIEIKKETASLLAPLLVKILKQGWRPPPGNLYLWEGASFRPQDKFDVATLLEDVFNLAPNEYPKKFSIRWAEIRKFKMEQVRRREVPRWRAGINDNWAHQPKDRIRWALNHLPLNRLHGKAIGLSQVEYEFLRFEMDATERIRSLENKAQ